MDCKDLVLDALNRVEEDFRAAVTGLSADQLAFRPTEYANSIAWLGWHLTRIEDDHVSHLAAAEQAWIEGKWYTRFGKSAGSRDTGYGHGPAQVAAIRPEGPEVLLEYYQVVHQRSLAYLQTLACKDMERVIDTSWTPPVTVGVRLISVVNDTTQHVGQMAYVRGLVARRT